MLAVISVWIIHSASSLGYIANYGMSVQRRTKQGTKFLQKNKSETKVNADIPGVGGWGAEGEELVQIYNKFWQRCVIKQSLLQIQPSAWKHIIHINCFFFYQQYCNIKNTSNCSWIKHDSKTHT